MELGSSGGAQQACRRGGMEPVEGGLCLIEVMEVMRCMLHCILDVGG